MALGDQVRRDWLRTFAARKSAPAGAEQFIATCLLRTDHTIRQALEAGWPLLRDLLDHTPAAGDSYAEGRQQLDLLIAQIASASAKRATLLAAAALLCAWEAKTDTHTWRQQSEQTRRYLTQMQTWGYTLSEVEILAYKEEPNA